MQPDDGGLWDEMISAAHAQFALSAVLHDVEVDPDGREGDLVNVALAAGVVGALQVLHDQEESPPDGGVRR